MASDKDGFYCSGCLKFHEFSYWLYAHWNEVCTHTCSCGQRHEIRRGKVFRIQQGEKRKAGERRKITGGVSGRRRKPSRPTVAGLPLERAS